jgi:hypothetical protein
MTPSWRASPSLLAAAAGALVATCLCATAAASDVHLPKIISESGVSRPEGKGLLRGGGGGGDGAVQLHDADAPHEIHGEEEEGGSAGGGGDEFQCNTEEHADYGGPIAFVWVGGNLNHSSPLPHHTRRCQPVRL